MSQSAVLVLSLTLVASEVQRGSAPLAVVLSRIGAPSDLQAVLRDQDTLADAEKRAVGQHSRESFWWVHHVKRHGGYATAVVPTLCKRVDRLSLLIDKLSLMSCIGEVMIVSRQLCIGIVQRIIDQHTATMAELGPHAEVVAVDMGGWDRIYGPAARFFAASRARQSVLVHLDDDEIPCEQQVCRLATQALQEPIGLYGHHKRVCTKETGYKVPANPNSKRWWHIVQFNVILTLFAATSRLVNDAFVRYFSPYAEALASTRGNGEDIAFNHFLLRHFNRTPTYVRKAECGDLIVNGSNVYDGGFSKLNDQVGISAGVHHYRLRKRMCRQLWFLQHWPAKRIGPQKYAGLIPLNHSVEGGQLSAV